uniref:Phosphatidic acid phosphatase type 2/haloperoxidase domain-containing protein n=1 Tax=Arcella intermedia TaxID=1963864 RepID=A0A6B2LC74_9EUKA
MYWVDFIVLLFFGMIAVICHFAMTPYDRFFVEQDPTLSYPYRVLPGDQAIPNVLIIILVIPVPLVILLIWVLVFRYCVKLKPGDRRIIDPVLVILAFLEAMAITIAITEFMKNFVGRKRPNFFAMCNYQGYRDALESNDLTAYLNVTVFGRPGNLSNCRELTTSILQDSQYSFPSGHSSSSFCALTFTAMYFMETLHHCFSKHQMTKGLVGICFIWAAAVIAGTRPRDYWHNFDDILSGSVIGLMVGAHIFYLNYKVDITTSLPGTCCGGEEDPDAKDKERQVEMNS